MGPKVHLQGDLTISTSLYQAGMTYLAASYIPFAIFFGLFFVVFRKAAAKRIEVMKFDSDVNQKKESVTLVLTISKVLVLNQLPPVRHPFNSFLSHR